MCQDQHNSLIVLGQPPFKIRWVGQDTLCYQLTKRPFTSGQVISTPDSKIPLWRLPTTPFPCGAGLPHGFLSWSLVLFRPHAHTSPHLVPHHPLHPRAGVPPIYWLAVFLPILRARLGAFCHPYSDWLCSYPFSELGWEPSATHSCIASWTQFNLLGSNWNCMNTDYMRVLYIQKLVSTRDRDARKESIFSFHICLVCTSWSWSKPLIG